MGLIKKAFRLLLLKAVKATQLHGIIDELIKNDLVEVCYRNSNAKDAVFHDTARVFNYQNDKNSITLGANSHVRGELLTFAYGGKIEIGSFCFIGEGSRIWSGEHIRIGDTVMISHGVNVIDTNSHETNHQERADGCIRIITEGHPTCKGNIKTAPIHIKDNAWINFNSFIMKGVTVGEGAIVGAHSVVTRDVPPHTLVAGNPAVVIKSLKG